MWWSFDYLNVCLPETVNPERQKSDLFNSVALFLAQQTAVREKQRDGSPSPALQDVPRGPGQVTLLSGPQLLPYSKMCLVIRASEVSSGSNSLREHRPKSTGFVFFYDYVGNNHTELGSVISHSTAPLSGMDPPSHWAENLEVDIWCNGMPACVAKYKGQWRLIFIFLWEHKYTLLYLYLPSPNLDSA